MALRTAPLVVSAVLLAAAGPADAHTKTVHDPRDAKGTSVDIESASVDHRGNKLLHLIEAYEPFRTKKAPCLHIRTSAEGHGYELCGSGRLRVNIIGQKPGESRVDVERPAPDQVLYVIPERKIGNPDAYWWISLVECACDFAPNRNEIKHSL